VMCRCAWHIHNLVEEVFESSKYLGGQVDVEPYTAMNVLFPCEAWFKIVHGRGGLHITASSVVCRCAGDIHNLVEEVLKVVNFWR
jgi:hypothetical protein